MKISHYTVVSNIIVGWSKALNLITWLYVAYVIRELCMFVAWEAILSTAVW